MTDDRLYLIHILECIERVEEYTSDGKQAFLADTKTQDAVLRNLQILAESATRLSDTVRERHSDVDWRGIAGFRNVVVHGYLGLDLDEVWAIVEHDLRSLRDCARRILDELGGAP